ncbi:MAG: response regulator transcription factor [Muribaculaceae bacterium]|nr:response regulator transcription factor [Muribaculaceae bacterium]
MATKIKCAFVDDEPLALSLLSSYAKRVNFIETAGEYSNAVEAMDGIMENPVDLIFLDIQMPHLNGLEFARMLPERTRIVFITAFGQYALDGFRVNALDYLLKPVSFSQFLEAANKAQQWFSLVDSSAKTGDVTAEYARSMFVKSDHKVLQIDFSKIQYVEGLKDYVKIYTTDSERPVLSLMSMKAMESILPPSRFIRVHRSFIVAKDKIREIDRNRIVFGDVYIPIGDSYKPAFSAFINQK